jgi:site-specific DNA recombinase
MLYNGTTMSHQTNDTGPHSTRVALYARVSTDLQARAEEGSLDTQVARLQREVEIREERHGPHQVVAVLREEGASGKNMERPALRRLVRLVESRKVDLVLVTRIDRLSRSLLDFLFLHETFDKRGVRFVSLNEQFDTSTPVGEAMLKLLLVFAELERKQTAERTKTAMHARAERGLWNGGAPILGYDSEGAGKLTVNEAEAAVVRVAFEQMVELRSARKVARWLNEQGHRQKRYVSRRRGDVGEREFSPAVVSKMLQNRHYLGEVANNGQWFPGRHEAIVDTGIFERVQELLEKNRQKGRPSTPASEHFYLLTGKLRCGLCEDYALTTSSGRGHKGKRYPYYRCVSFTKKAVSRCDVGLVPAARLEAVVLAVVREAARTPDLVAKAIAETERILREEMTPARDRLSALRGERDAVKVELDRGFSAMTSGDLQEVGYFGQRMKELDQRFGQLEAAIAEEETRLSEAEGRRLDLDLAVQALRGFDTAFEYLTPHERKEFLDLMIDEVVVYPDHIEIALYEGSAASVALEKVDGRSLRRKKTPKGSGGVKGNGRKQQTPVPDDAEGQGFVQCIDWLPSVDHRQNRGGRGGGAEGDPT